MLMRRNKQCSESKSRRCSTPRPTDRHPFCRLSLLRSKFCKLCEFDKSIGGTHFWVAMDGAEDSSSLSKSIQHWLLVGGELVSAFDLRPICCKLANQRLNQRSLPVENVHRRSAGPLRRNLPFLPFVHLPLPIGVLPPCVQNWPKGINLNKDFVSHFFTFGTHFLGFSYLLRGWAKLSREVHKPIFG